MAKDPTIESHIADSHAMIDKTKPETVEVERRVDRARHLLERSRNLLEVARDPLHLAGLTSDVAPGAAEDRPGAPRKKRAPRKANAKSRR